MTGLDQTGRECASAAQCVDAIPRSENDVVTDYCGDSPMVCALDLAVRRDPVHSKNRQTKTRARRGSTALESTVFGSTVLRVTDPDVGGSFETAAASAGPVETGAACNDFGTRSPVAAVIPQHRSHVVSALAANVAQAFGEKPMGGDRRSSIMVDDWRWDTLSRTFDSRSSAKSNAARQQKRSFWTSFKRFVSECASAVGRRMCFCDGFL